MASNSLGTLSLDLIVQTGGFESGLDKAERLADKKTRQIERLAKERAKGIEDAFSNMAKSIAGPLAAALGAGTFTGLVKGLADAGDQLQKLSAKTGITVENLSKLQYAGSLAGPGTEELGSSLTKLNRVMGDAATGSKAATEALARFDIKPGTGALDAFKQIADRVKATGDETLIATGLNDLFGKSWSDLLPLLRGGSEGIKSAGDELERMGGVMSGELAASSEAFNDNITRLLTKMNALKIEVIGPLIPLFLQLSGEMATTSDKSDKLSTSGQLLKTIFQTVTIVGAEVAYVFRGIGAEIGGIAAQAAALGRGDFKAFSNIGAAMREDAEKARKEVDALTARLMNPLPVVATTPSATQGPGIINTPTLPKPVKVPRAASLSNQISEGQRLIEQLRERLLGTQNLTEVEKLQAQFANEKYGKATAGEKAIALGIAEQIDSRKALQTELDAELAIARELTAEYDRQASRLASLVSGTNVGQNQQRMLDEALAESALRSGDIDTTQYDQIIEKLREVKDAGGDAFAELTQAVNGFGDKAADAITEFVLTGKLSFSDLTRSVVADLLKMSIQQTITRPLFGAAAGWLEGLTKSADGNVFAGGSLHRYVNTVQNSPKAFTFEAMGFAKGGVFAEAGPEAVMPLSRDSDGVLGIKVSGGTQAPSITVNVYGSQNAPDVKRAAGQGAREALNAFRGAQRYA